MTDEQRETAKAANPGAAGYVPPWPRSRPPCAAPTTAERDEVRENVFELRDVTVSYGGKPAVAGVSMDIYRNDITALIGPSGCGKSTLIRCLNRMNDLIPTRQRRRAASSTTARTSTRPQVDPVEVRKRIGMVFQKPNPFPKSIFENVAFGPRILGHEGRRRAGRAGPARAPRSGTRSRTASTTNAYGMSGGQQQRLCIARCLAVDPDVILMDEPCSALDPISTGQDRGPDDGAEGELLDRDRHPQHAAGGARVRPHGVPDRRARPARRHRRGRLVEYDETEKIFTNPADQRTEDYVSGKVG